MANPDSLVEQLLEQMLFGTGWRASESEQKSWSRSLPVLANDLIEAASAGSRCWSNGTFHSHLKRGRRIDELAGRRHSLVRPNGPATSQPVYRARGH